MIVIKNGRLLFAHSTANVQASHQSIHKLWPGEFLSLPSQSQPSVSWDFGASRHRHVPPAPTTIYSPMDWGLGWRRLVICFSEIWDMLLQPFLCFFYFVSRCRIMLNKSSHKIRFRECLELFILTARQFFLCTGFYLTHSQMTCMVCLCAHRTPTPFSRLIGFIVCFSVVC